MKIIEICVAKRSVMTHILITNDDGVDAPGLLALALEMRSLGEVTVVVSGINPCPNCIVTSPISGASRRIKPTGGRLDRVWIDERKLP